MRGKHTLKKVSHLINPEQMPLFPQPAETSLYEEKVKLIIARYYYFNTQNMRSEDILLKLQAEFFISTARIADIISERIPEIQALRKDAPKKDFFKIKWAHLVW